MGDPGDEHEALGVVHRVHDPVVADSDPEVVTPGELRRAPRTWVCCKPVDRGFDPVAHGTTEPAKRSHGFRVQPDLIHPGLRAALADIAPRDRDVTLVASLKRSEAVLEVVEPLEELGVPL
jgi:hypothetical protein